MNRYYTPTIDEFHDGFEYEVLVHFGEWEKHVFAHGKEAEYLDTKNDYTPKTTIDYFKFARKNFRVKYLDKEDIESLGWKEYKSGFYEKGNNLMLHNDDGISIIVKDPSKDESMMYSLRSNEVYMINIKNKSELKKLLQQLGL